MRARRPPRQRLLNEHHAVGAFVAIVLLLGCAALLARALAPVAATGAGVRGGAATGAAPHAGVAGGGPVSSPAEGAKAPTRASAAPHPAADVPARSTPEADAAAASPSSATVTGLDPELLRRFRAAAKAAAADGVTLTITSGWRSAAAQQRIVAADIAAYGSVTEAHRWVLPPDKSAHVRGEAIDVGPAAGATWLAAHGAAFGLCRTYANETWHFEPVIAPGGTCPAPHPDSSWGW
jgi:hypothetical protein